jgi:hypothetical protein
MKKIHITAAEPAGRISCPQCGNDSHFVEIIEQAIMTNHYQQHSDGSFTLVQDLSDTFGTVSFLCEECGEDMTQFHEHLLEMLF